MNTARLSLFILCMALAWSCAKRNVVETPPPPPPPAPEPEVIVEEKKTLMVEPPVWQQVSINDVPELEYAVDIDYVGSVWQVRPEAFAAQLSDEEKETVDIPAPSGLKAYYVTSRERNSWNLSSTDERCEGTGSGSALGFRFNMTCTDVTYTLEPLLSGSNSFYAVVKKK